MQGQIAAKPLLFRGGVGVGSLPTRYGCVQRSDPTPNPSPEEEGSK